MSLLVPAVSNATDARMSYVTPAGNTQALGMAAAICGVDSGGNLKQCVSGNTADNKYTALNGGTNYLGYIVPVCSVVDGVPQVCSLYIVDIFGAGAGKRTTISWRKVS